MQIVDSHAHPFMPEFAADRPAMLRRAREAGVCRFVAVGYDLESSRQAVKMAEREADVSAAVAIHPHHAEAATADALDALAALAAHQRVVAIGEVGLDFYRDLAPRDAQERAFRLQLGLARRMGLPVVIHDRDAHPETMAVLAQEAATLPAVILHCFSGDPKMAEEAVARGYYLGIGGPVTYRNARSLRAAVQVVPLERLLLETDAPYLPPEPHRGHRNESAYLPLIATALAALKGVPVDTLAAVTTANARRVFRLRDGGV